MIKRVTIGDLRLTFTAARITKVIGVNSQLDDGMHVLMWDFDNVLLRDAGDALRRVQTRYFLSDIYILRSSIPDNYIAYCFSSQDWRKAIEIIAQTEFTDLNFFKYGVYRGRFTLRVSAKKEQRPYLVAKLPGYEQADCFIEELNSWVRYETLR